ncbi:hypothetical protein ENKNEFLB_01252 [Nocardioides aquaticus]|uniref:HlyC/CorC family transporter n=1 Tax=Nocardioides aquaticus TaxID=160826 RepID=A0ABX8EF12_9ACTN|nr:hemolysin family protein [Nocardioides aquaticus]QVT78874.1 hypothetical protein ENKNEFLB_01252 [Nocardioides aquaticus]
MSLDNPYVVVVVTTALIALSAFFVAAEFALLAAKRHRLQDQAATSRSARAALRSADELTVLLAGSQLGITACALALGAITKPAVNYALTPLFADWGAPSWVAGALGFALALVVVTFLHLVVGEMAPKSWAIAHPESAATLLALPMRGFMWLFRPLLLALNEAANWCLRRVGVEPQDTVSTGQTPDDLRQLVEHSAAAGTLDARWSSQITEALDLADLTLDDLVRWDRAVTAVGSRATVGEVRDLGRSSGHLRILLRDAGPTGPAGAVTGVVHVRDTLVLDAGDTVEQVARPPYHLPAATPVYAALADMRETRQHLAVVTAEDGRVGVVTMEDVLVRLFPAVDSAA